MESATEPAAATWFELAAQFYVDKHQGCPWCGGSHCVFRSPRPDRIEYACSACDFFVCHHHKSGRYFSSAGATATAAGF